MDKWLLRQIRRTAGKKRMVDLGMTHVAKRGPLWFFFVLGLVLLFAGKIGLQVVLCAVIAAVLTRGFNELAGWLYPRKRPFVQEGFTPLLPHAPTSSFPSSHAACGFALAVAVWFYLPLVGSVMLVMALMLAFSRLFVGVHYPLDVLVGALIGTGIAYAVVLVFRAIA